MDKFYERLFVVIFLLLMFTSMVIDTFEKNPAPPREDVQMWMHAE